MGRYLPPPPRIPNTTAEIIKIEKDRELFLQTKVTISLYAIYFFY